MKVRELIEALKKYDSHLEVVRNYEGLHRTVEEADFKIVNGELQISEDY